MAGIKEIGVFIASPSDVQDERDAVERVVKRVNHTLQGIYPVRLHALRWETAVQPAIGGDAQDIVNSQVAGEYEVFIGILWMHFGTPTPRSDSGTLEEFEGTVARHNEDPSSVSVMFYFKDAPRAPMDIDAEQLQKVQEFRRRYRDSGIYGTFTDIRNFEETLQITLTRLAIDWQNRRRQAGGTLPSNPLVQSYEDGDDDSGESEVDPPPPQEFDDEAGFLDSIEEGARGFSEGTGVSRRLGKHIEELGKRMGQGVKDLKAAVDRSGNISSSESKRIINALASDIEGIATGIQAEIVPFKNTFTTGIRAYGRAADLLSDFGGDTTQQVGEAISNATRLEREIGKAQQSLLGLKNSLEGHPRVTSKYNRAKRKMLEVLAELDREMSAARTSTTQTIRFFEELCKKS